MPNNKELNESFDTITFLLPKIKKLLKERKFLALKELLVKIHPIDIAETFHEFENNEKIFVFRLLLKDTSIEVFEALPFEAQSFLLDNLQNIEVSEILNDMAPDERVDLFQELNMEEMNKFFNLMEKEEVEDVKSLIHYEEGTAGSLMTTEVVKLEPEMSAKDALIKLQAELKAGDSEHIYSSYVCDHEGCLLGAIDLQDLVTSKPSTPVNEIMTNIDNFKLDPNTEDEKVAELFVKYDLLNVPIIDENNRLLGAVVFDDIVDMIRQESTKEIYELGKMHIEEGEEVSYESSSSFDLLRRRAGWLLFLLVLDFLTGTVLKTYEGALSRVVALSFFIPMLLGTGGNAGTQVSVSMIRGLATGDVNFENAWKIIKKEFFAALWMSLFVGIIAFLRAYLLQGEFIISCVIGGTMIVITILAVSTGVFLPLLAKKLKLDPAVLAGPVTTSLVDILGLIIYFNIAMFFLPALQGLV
ncbi:MAG: magnesium transporter [bacterium]|nr:magnesium transporter [bacterium]